MCSISGTVNFDESYIKKMVDYQTNRGPDFKLSAKLDCEIASVFFGHTLLSIIGYQPQPIAEDGNVLTYNGVWYNYKDHYPEETSDTVALLKHLGNSESVEKAIENINGMFAFGYYDRQKEKIFCAVDRFGQKPLYYYHENNKFAFASTPAALLHIKDKWEINPDALQSYWLLGSTMGDNSIWSGIKKLCASELLEYDIKNDEITIKRYWEPKYQENAQENIETLIFDAINKVKVSDVPVHIFLSGGIDSTLVASQFENGKAIHLNSPEKQWAKYVAEKYKIDLKTVDPQEVEVEECLTDYSRQCGEPSAASIIPYITAKEASRFGKVGIIANAFDELFFGYSRTHQDYTNQIHIYRYEFMPEGGTLMPYETHGKWYCGGRWEELMTFVQFDLNKTLDFAAGCHGMEIRSPGLDHRLVECALSIYETEHRKNGDKSILKAILKRFGFHDQFLNRAKIGFSLHYQPPRMPELIKKSLNWCLSEGYLKCDFEKMNGRDKRYIEMAALSFYFWFQTWKDKIV